MERRAYQRSEQYRGVFAVTSIIDQGLNRVSRVFVIGCGDRVNGIGEVLNKGDDELRFLEVTELLLLSYLLYLVS